MEPRQYQTNFIEAVEAGWKTYRKQLGVAPTGSGKTIVFSFLAQRLLDATGRKTLILAHRDELIDQAINKLYSATGIVADKEKSEFRARLTAPVVVASVQTMLRRMDRWDPDHFGMVIGDEAHHSLSPSWQSVFAHFPNANILGVTATPDRGDARDLGEFFENVAYEIPLLDLVHQGFLCPFSIKSVPIKIDLGSSPLDKGDFAADVIDHALEPYLDRIAEVLKDNIGHRKTLCFLPLRSTSQKFVDACRRVGITSNHIDGDSEDRQTLLAGYARGDFQLLSNAMLLTEGYDCPDISCIVVLRPTKSRPLFAQMVGRGTRIADGKHDLLLFDLLWLHAKHNIIRPANLFAKTQEEADSITEVIQEKAAAVPEDVASQLAIDLEGVMSEAAAKREDALRKKLEALQNRKSKFISAEEFSLDHHALQIAEFQPTMRWHSDPMTPAQAKYLEKAGIDVSTIKNKGQASVALDVVFKESSIKPATKGVMWMMQKSGWRSKDNKRGPFQATQSDQRDFFASRGKRAKSSTPKPDNQGAFFA